MEKKLLFHLLRAIVFSCTILVIKPSLYAQKENFNVFDKWVEWSNGENMLQLYLNQEAYQLLDQRDMEIAQLKTRGDWESRQLKVKEAFAGITAPFPEKTPLNPKITGIIQKDSFRIEKIVFESLPGYFVTGCLFIPNNIETKRPAILYVSGHSDISYKSPVYQNVIYNLVDKGFVVFAFDPMGQGERYQYYNPGQEVSKLGQSWFVHTYADLQCLLAGESISKYFIWDGIRAIDYMQTREEIDPGRIGITGRSGGGMQSAYIAAFDERVLACAPENYITSHRKLLRSIGPQDGEQNFYHWLSEGLAIQDLLVMRMPKPTLMITTTRDFFSIQGARDTYREILKGYTAFNKEGDFKIVEDHATHSSTKHNREEAYRFFQKYLSLPGDSKDKVFETLTQEELNVTKTGQVLTSLGGESVFSLNKKVCDRLYKNIEASRQSNKDHLELVKKESARLSGYHLPVGKMEVTYRGGYQREGYTVDMYALDGEGKYVIPLLIASPDSRGLHPVVIYIHPEGKQEGIASGGIIEKLVKQGCIVVAPDLLGIGETKSNRKYPASHGMEAQLIGRSIVGIQAGDITRVVDFSKKLPGADSNNIQAVAFDEQCPALLHAAVYNPAIKGIALVKAPVSYYNITQTKLYKYDLSFNWGVAGVLTAYDLPDLAACIAPRKLTFIGMLNGQKEPASKDLIIEQMEFPKSIYTKSCPENLKIVPIINEGISTIIIDWLKE